MELKEKEENIKQTFLKGIKELDNKEKDMHDGWDFVELVNQFICAFDNEYQYNKMQRESQPEIFIKALEITKIPTICGQSKSRRTKSATFFSDIKIDITSKIWCDGILHHLNHAGT